MVEWIFRRLVRLALCIRTEICQMYCQKFVSGRLVDDYNVSRSHSHSCDFLQALLRGLCNISLRFVSPAFTVIVVAVIFWFYTV